MARITQPGDLLRVPQVAAITGLKESTIRSWILQRRIRFVKLSGGAVRIRRRDLEELIETSVVQTRSPEEVLTGSGERD